MLAPGRVSRLAPCVSQSLRSDARCCDAGSGVVSPACLPVSAVGCQVVSPACLPVSPSLCGRILDAVTCLPVSAVRCQMLSHSQRALAPAKYLPLVALCLPGVCGRMPAPGSCLLLVSQSMRSDARCCYAVVSPACLAVCGRMPAGSGVVSPQML